MKIVRRRRRVFLDRSSFLWDSLTTLFVYRERLAVVSRADENCAESSDRDDPECVEREREREREGGRRREHKREHKRTKKKRARESAGIQRAGKEIGI
jgi:hypothetical protein